MVFRDQEHSPDLETMNFPFFADLGCFIEL